MAQLKIERERIENIKEYKNNPRRNEKAVESVKNSIKKIGYENPMIIDEDNVLLAGHTRLAALKKTKTEEVDVIRISHLTDQEKKAFRIADNRTHEFSSWDGSLLEIEMREIKMDDWKQFGFNERLINKVSQTTMCKCPKCGNTFARG